MSEKRCIYRNCRNSGGSWFYGPAAFIRRITKPSETGKTLSRKLSKIGERRTIQQKVQQKVQQQGSTTKQ
ncbi:MAG: hypothetical protein EDM05_66640 [Leptolyngbya sp. IPPAS B-1204]|nr:MAG: hypothetical protein EDM05_18560 [Leptolyngbya sp. IPPAS B-1204]